MHPYFLLYLVSSQREIVNIAYNISINYCLIFFAGIVGIGCGVVVLYKPGLQLPENSHFQLFVSNHPFEIYNSKLKNEFWFEKAMSVCKKFHKNMYKLYSILS